MITDLEKLIQLHVHGVMLPRPPHSAATVALATEIAREILDDPAFRAELRDIVRAWLMVRQRNERHRR